MIELGTGFHPELTGQENVFLNASIQGLSRDDAMAVYDSVVSYSGLRHFMDVPLKNYSSGMSMRLGFAIAATMDPDVLLLDEIFAVGDADFQRQCMGTLQSFQTRGKTIIFVSHSSAAVQAVCRRVAVLDHGRLLDDGGVDDGLTEYRRLTALSPHEALGPQPGDGAGGDGASRRTSPAIRISPGTGLRPEGAGTKRARGCSISCAVRGCGATSTSSMSAAAASRPPVGCCPSWSQATTGDSRRTSSSSSPAPTSSCRAPACGRNLATSSSTTISTSPKPRTSSTWPSPAPSSGGCRSTAWPVRSPRLCGCWRRADVSTRPFRRVRTPALQSGRATGTRHHLQRSRTLSLQLRDAGGARRSGRRQSRARRGCEPPEGGSGHDDRARVMPRVTREREQRAAEEASRDLESMCAEVEAALADLRRLNARYQQVQQDSAAIQSKIAAIRASNSWRAIETLRRLKRRWAGRAGAPAPAVGRRAPGTRGPSVCSNGNARRQRRRLSRH